MVAVLFVVAVIAAFATTAVRGEEAWSPWGE